MIDATAVGDPAETGIMLFLSPDLEDSVHSVMNSKCTELDSACYQAVIDVLEASDRVLKAHSLEERQVGMLEGAAVAVAGILFVMFYRLVSNHDIPVPLVIPVAHIEDASSLGTATAIVVVTEGGSGVTVTAPPDQDIAYGRGSSTFT